MIDVKIIKKPKNKAATPTLRTPGAAYGDKSVKEAVHASKADTAKMAEKAIIAEQACLLYTSPSPRDQRGSRMPSSA